MPLALLLSPDDQAVSAITAVLEEMLVTWERPLDGVSAAQKLNSHSFDLVLVDCENLPAAKLIFDVCRRGKGGNTPVPIAIVDGRAGLPTAFRLGAELILTKPVAKDQARITIRTAVGRVKKEEPAHHSPSANELSAVHEEAMQPATDHANHETLFQSDRLAMPQERAVAAAAAATSSQLTSFSDFAPATLSAPSSTATMSTTVAIPEREVAAAAQVPSVVVKSKPLEAAKPSDDPVLAELEKAEAEAEAKPERPAPSSGPQIHNMWEQKQPQSELAHKTRGSLVAVFVLMLAGAGVYAAWMYEPGFKAIAQPKIDRVLALVGVARQPQPYTQTPVKPAAEPANVPATSADSVPPSQPPATNASAATTPSVTPPSAAPASSPAAMPVSASSSSGALASGAASTAADAATSAPAKFGLNQIDVARMDASQKSSTKIALNPSNEDNNKNVAAAPSSDAELPGEKTAIILSSKGADKRLVHSVQPTYPAGVRPLEVQGTLVLKTVVDENGKVVGARVIEGNDALANAAISAVKQWRYRPYVRDGKALPFQTIVLVDFQRR